MHESGDTMKAAHDGSAPGDVSTFGSKLEVFRYVVEKNAPIYRAIVDVFVDAKARYRIQLRVEELARELRTRGDTFGKDEIDLARHLDVLHDWGNLKRTQDTRDAATLAEFYRRRSLYQLTPEGEEARKGVLAVERVFAATGGRLSSIMLPAIAERLAALRAELAAAQPDAARLYTLLKELHGFSTELADNARRFMNDLEESLTNLALTDEAFLAYKRAILVYLQGFVSELNRYQPGIIAAVENVDALGADRMAALASTADEAPAPDGSRRGPVLELKERWDALRAWFSGTPHRRAEAEHLRDAARDAIGRILRVLERLNEKRFLRVNRAADLLQLARWFAAAKTQDEAHALFNVAFGLHAARHFSLASADDEIDRGRSWWETVPVQVAPRLREAGRRSNPGRPGAIADYSSRKQTALHRLRAEEERTVQAAQRLLGRPAHLSELGQLDRPEFDVFLALLDAALRSPLRPDLSRRAIAMGQYVVTLVPPADDGEAVIETRGGRFTVPDFHLSVAERGERAAHRVRSGL